MEDRVNFSAAMKRIQAISGCRTQVELALALGIRQSSISDAKRRQSIPEKWLVKLFYLHGANPAWIMGAPVHPYLVEDMSRDAPGMPTVTTDPVVGADQTAGDLLVSLRGQIGNGHEVIIVPAGSRVMMEMPKAACFIDDMEFVGGNKMELPSRPAA